MPAARPDASSLFKIIDGESHVALAVSGGSDSLALLRLAHEWAASKRRLTALTVDHGLRPGSAAEAKQAAKWSEGLGISHVTLEWQGAKPGTGLQAKARNARYDLMAGWCRNNGAGWLLTGHTLDDQAETVIMRLARTTSIESIAGIHPVSEWKGVRLFRPLLAERRQALQDYLRAAGQPWIDDPSNEDERFERVRIRKAMPELGWIGIGPEGLASLANEAREVSLALHQAALEWAKDHAAEHETGYCTVPLEALAGQGDRFRARILGLLIGRYGAGHLPEPAELSHLSDWLGSGSGARRTLGGAVIARRMRELVIGREPGRIDATPVIVPQSGRLLWDGRFEVSAGQGSRVLPLSAAGRWPRRPDIPAFVQAGLPAILGRGGEVEVPHLGIGEGARARFSPAGP